MPSRRENLTSAVDGVTDVFSTVFPYVSGSLMLGYNGQVYPVGVNIDAELSATTFRISFVPDPECTTALHIIYEDIGTDSDSGMQASGLPPGC
jgi:hypothetical protein